MAKKGDLRLKVDGKVVKIWHPSKTSDWQVESKKASKAATTILNKSMYKLAEFEVFRHSPTSKSPIKWARDWHKKGGRKWINKGHVVPLTAANTIKGLRQGSCYTGEQIRKALAKYGKVTSVGGTHFDRDYYVNGKHAIEIEDTSGKIMRKYPLV